MGGTGSSTMGGGYGYEYHGIERNGSKEWITTCKEYGGTGVSKSVQTSAGIRKECAESIEREREREK